MRSTGATCQAVRPRSCKSLCRWIVIRGARDEARSENREHPPEQAELFRGSLLRHSEMVTVGASRLHGSRKRGGLPFALCLLEIAPVSLTFFDFGFRFAPPVCRQGTTNLHFFLELTLFVSAKVT